MSSDRIGWIIGMLLLRTVLAYRCGNRIPPRRQRKSTNTRIREDDMVVGGHCTKTDGLINQDQQLWQFCEALLRGFEASSQSKRQLGPYSPQKDQPKQPLSQTTMLLGQIALRLS